jgi:hypothetical protein
MMDEGVSGPVGEVGEASPFGRIAIRNREVGNGAGPGEEVRGAWDRGKQNTEVKRVVNGQRRAPDAAAEAVGALFDHDETGNMDDNGGTAMHQVQKFEFADESMEGRIFGATTTDDVVRHHVVGEIEDALPAVPAGVNVFFAENLEEGTELTPIGGLTRGSIPGTHPIFGGAKFDKIPPEEVNTTATTGTTAVTPSDDAGAFVTDLDGACKAPGDGTFPPVQAGVSLGVDDKGGVESGSAAQFGGIHLRVETVIQLAEVDRANVARGGRDEGLKIPNDDAEGQGSQGAGLFSSEEANQADGAGFFVGRETAAWNAGGIVKEAAEFLNLGRRFGLGRVTDQAKADCSGHNMVQGALGLAIGWPVDLDVVDVDPDQDSGLTILTYEDTANAEFGIISFAIPATGEIVDDNRTPEIGTGANDLAEKSGAKTSGGAWAVAGAHGEPIVAENFMSLGVDDAKVPILGFPSLEHVKIFTGVHNGRETPWVEAGEDVIGTRHVHGIGCAGVIDVAPFAVRDASVLVGLARFWNGEDRTVIEDLVGGRPNHAKGVELVDKIAGNAMFLCTHCSIFHKAWWRGLDEIHGGALAEFLPVLSWPFPPEDRKILGSGRSVVGTVFLKLEEALGNPGVGPVKLRNDLSESEEACLEKFPAFRQVGDFPGPGTGWFRKVGDASGVAWTRGAGGQRRLTRGD